MLNLKLGSAGLGLSISSQVVMKKHAGNLLCRSELGHGTASGVADLEDEAISPSTGKSF